MNKSFLKRLSSCFQRRNTRHFRGSSRSSLVQVLEPRHLLTAPTLDMLYDVTLAEDAAEKSVPLSGITDADSSTQPLRVTASSSNISLIVAPTVDYNSPDSTGTLRFTPVADRSGLTTITVTVEDGGADLDLSTAGDNEKFSRTFNVTVTPVNDNPTLSPLPDVSIPEDAPQQTVSLSGISAGGGESQPLRVRAVSSNTSLIPNPSVTYSSPATTGSIRFTPVANQYGAATITVSVEDGGLDGNLNTAGDNRSVSRSFVVNIINVNDAPVMDSIADVTVSEDASEQTVNLQGISAGPSESQLLRITASSSNTSLIPDPAVQYTTPDATGNLLYTPAANLSGSATITVTLEDAGLDEDFGTTSDNLSITRTFLITVVPVNDAPTLDPAPDLSLTEDDPEQVVALTGITAGGGESQPLRVTASSSNSALIPNPSVTYTSADSTGSIRFTPVADRNGSATITIVVEDGGLDGDLSTASDNSSVTRTFTVTVSSVNDTPTLDPVSDLTINEDAVEQSVNLSGISAGGGESQPLRVTVSSSDTGIIPTPSITYSTPDSTGVVRFTPVADQSGNVTISVTVEDAGLDGDFSTSADNLTTTRTFLVTVTAINDLPTLNPLANVIVARSAPEQTVNLVGISAGGGESQPLRVTATSSDSAVVPDPAIDYSSPDATGTLRYTPVPGISGTATITVSVEDAGLDGDLSTSGDNGLTTRTFLITVNNTPTLDTLANVTVTEDAAEESVSLTGISAGDGETQNLRVTASSDNTALIPAPRVTYSSPDATGTLNFTPAPDQIGTAVITVTVEDAGIDGDFATTVDNVSFSRTFTITVTAVNDTPTLDPVTDRTVDEDAAEQTVNLTGISAGGGESQTLRITASSGNPALIADPTVNYSSPDAVGSLRFTPTADLSGVAVITVTVEDAGLDNDLSTAGDNLFVSRSFTITVNPVNDAPTVDSVTDQSILEDAAEQTVNLSGITAGGAESQPLKVTAVSSNTSLIPAPAVTYTSPDSNGTVRFTPAANLSGQSTITVTVEDGGLDGDLSTAGDNAVRSISFVVTVSAVNDAPTVNQPADVSVDEDSAEKTITLTGISAGGDESQPLKVTASSSNTTLLADLSIVYSSPDATGSLKFTPALDQYGSTTVTVTVEDGGLDGDLATSADNQTSSTTFVVTVNPINDQPTLTAPANLSIDEDAPEQTVDLTGISAGGGESQPLRITASSSNTSLIPHPAVIYTSAETSGSLKFTPTPELSGSATITVTIEDGGLDLDLATTADNQTLVRNILVTVNAVNDAPLLDSLYDLTVSEDSAEQTVDLSGIAAGSDESQQLRVTATSSDPAIVPNPSVTYTSPEANGTIRFTPAANRHGVVTITVTVEDAGLDGDLATTADNQSVSQSFLLTVTPLNDLPGFNPIPDLTILEDASEQTIDVTGINAGPFESQPLRLTATSSNPALVPTPAVDYTSDNPTGTLKFTPVADASGVSTITVTLEDGGLDGNLATAADNLSVTRTFVVSVTAVNDTPTLDVLYDLSLDEDVSEQTIDLTGITAGGGESQPLKVSVTSDNTTLIPSPSVTYSSADPTGSIRFTPVGNLSGLALITVTVEDGGLDGDLSTTSDNSVFSRTFSITVTPVNDAPTLTTPGDITLDEDAVEQTVALSGITAGGGESQPLRVTASSSNPSLIPDPSVVYTSAETSGALRFTPVADASGTSVITVVVEDGGFDGNLSTTDDNLTTTRSFTVTVRPVNDAPTLDALYDLSVDEDSSEQTVSLSGISAGGSESQPIRVTAVSDRTGLIPDPQVIYSSADSTGTLKWTPLADQYGSAMITVVIEDGGLDADLSTSADNATVTTSFRITVNPVNDLPTIDPADDMTIGEDAPQQTVTIQGIFAGPYESQPLRLTAVSSETGLIPAPSVDYTSDDTVGSIKFTPVPGQSGTATITLTVEDGGLDGDLSTPADNLTVQTSFTVTVTAVNDAPTLAPPGDIAVDEDATEQTVALSGITAGDGESQPLRVTATSSNTALIPDPAVDYTSDASTGALRFTPVADLSGSAVITVVVEDGGLDGDLSTAADNLTITRTFTVTVNPVNDVPTLDAIDDLTIAEDASEQIIELTGIFAGGGESQPLQVVVTSSNNPVVPEPAVLYTSDATTGRLFFTPVSDQHGSAVITVVIEDGGLDGDLSTTGDNLTVTRTFTVTVNPVNDVPTLDTIDDLTIDEDAPEQTINLTGIYAGGADSQPLRVTATSSNSALIPDPAVDYVSDNTTGALRFTPVADQNGSAVITVVVEDGGDDGDLSTAGDNLKFTVTFTVTVNPVNDVPTLDTIDDLNIDEDAPEQTVNLSGIFAGGGESQPLRMTATSSNTTLIADPSVDYTSDASSGALRFTPTADLSGSAVITVVVEDGGLDGDLSTAADNLTSTRTFTVTVNPVNDAPTLDPINDLVVDEDAPEQTVNLSGIFAGGGESQPLWISATSSNPALIPDPAVDYTSADSTGALRFTPVADQSGAVVISVVVEDGGLDGDLSTAWDNGNFVRTFSVTVNPVNDTPTLNIIDDVTVDEDAPEQTVSLSGIFAGGGESQPLRVTATSTNTALIPDPAVDYTSDASTGALRFTPVADQSGSAVITVVVEDGGLDGDLSTTGDNLTVTQTFTVTVNPVNDAPTLDTNDDLTIDEDAAEQTVSLSGISAGGGESQPLRVTATSSNNALIPDPAVDYVSDKSTGTIRFTPIADLSGSTVITVVVEDGGLDGDLSTTADNLTVSHSFTVTVTPINDAPTLNSIDDLTIDEDASEQTVSLSGIFAGGGESQPLRVTATSSNTGLIPDPAVDYISDNSIGALRFTPVADQSGSAVITVVVEDGGLDGDLSTTGDNLTVTRTFAVTVNPVNDAPTLNTIDDLTINEDASEQTVNLSGIFAGGGESQPLRVIATSSNTTLIADPGVDYTSDASIGALRFTPTADLSGSAVITVVVEDGGLDGDLSTAADNLTNTRTFTVTVNPVNDAPTLDPINDLVVDEDAPEQTANLSGIFAGGGESQPLRVTATSSNSSLIPDPAVDYTSADSTGALRFTPVADQSGSAVITVVVEDGGLDGDLSTAGDNLTVTRSFTVTVNPVNDTPTLNIIDDVTVDEDAPEQTVSLSGIFAGGGESQPLRVTATSSNTALIPDPAVDYTSDASTGALRFTPVADLSGSAVITVVVEDGGLDGDLSTAGDNLTVTQTFTVTVNPVNDAPTLDTNDDLTIDEDAAEQTVSLSGISAGGGESQPLRVTATSSNNALIPDPAVDYVSDKSTGTIRFTPIADLSGSTVITVVVEDGGLDGDLSTTADNLTVSHSFTVTVTPINDAPTLNSIDDLTIDEDASEQTVSLSGIFAGGGESQPLRVTATSSNKGLIPDAAVDYISDNSTGALRFTPVANQNGSAVITVVVEDGGLDGDLSTAGDNLTVTRTFNVTVNPINDVPTLNAIANLTISEDSSERTVELTGISAGGMESQPLRVTVTSSNTALIPVPAVDYTSPASIGSLRFTPVAVRTGSSVITVTVEDGGLDGDLATTADNLLFERSFTVFVQPIRPVILSPVGSTLSQRPMITWTAVPEAVTYRIYISNLSTGQAPAHTGFSSSTQYQVPVDLGIGRMEIYVRAIRSDGTQLPWSVVNRVTINTRVVINPVAPRQTVTRPTLSWAPIPGAARYDVWVDNRSTNQTQYIRTSVTATEWSPSVDLPMSRFTVWVRAIAADNTPAAWSQQVDFYVAAPPQPVTPLTATFDRRQTFEWTPVAGATSYGFYLRNLVNGFVVANVSGLSAPRFTPQTNLADGTYAWWAIAESGVANFRSDWSARVEIYVGGRPTVTGPLGQVTTLNPVIQWTPVIGAAKYDVWVDRTFGSEISINAFKSFGVTGNSLVTPVSLVSGAEYRVWIRAISTTGEVSAWSKPLDFSVSFGGLVLNSNDDDSNSVLALLTSELDTAVTRTVSEKPAANRHADQSTIIAETTEQQELVAQTPGMQPGAPTAATISSVDPVAEMAEFSLVDASIQDIVEQMLSGERQGSVSRTRRSLN